MTNSFLSAPNTPYSPLTLVMPYNPWTYTEQIINVCCTKEMYYLYSHLNTGVQMFWKFAAPRQHKKIYSEEAKIRGRWKTSIGHPFSAHLERGSSGHWDRALGSFPAARLMAGFIPALRRKGCHFSSKSWSQNRQTPSKLPFLSLLNRLFTVFSFE